MPNKNFSNVTFRKLVGIFVAATVGFLFISAFGAYLLLAALS